MSMFNNKEVLKTMILQYRDMIKNVEKGGGSCEAWKRELKSFEDTYLYHSKMNIH